jgi:hypothetical protein
LCFVVETPNVCVNSTMRILIQHGLTRSYYNGAVWDSSEARAAEFESVIEAENICREQKLANALIVLKFSDAGEEISYRVFETNAPDSRSPIRFQGLRP